MMCFPQVRPLGLNPGHPFYSGEGGALATGEGIGWLDGYQMVC